MTVNERSVHSKRLAQRLTLMLLVVRFICEIGMPLGLGYGGVPVNLKFSLLVQFFLPHVCRL